MLEELQTPIDAVSKDGGLLAFRLYGPVFLRDMPAGRGRRP